MLEWGAAHRRDLPWRATRDPWRILVSEVMLQQTQVDRVVGYYRAFLRAFPSAGECARARPGRRGAALVRSGLQPPGAQSAPGGRGDRTTSTEVPSPPDEPALRALPGVGPYTARAVRSFAFGADVAAVDTNVLRVLARGVAGSGVTMGEAQSMADRLLPGRTVVGVQPGHVRSGRHGVHRGPPVVRRVPPAPAVPVEAPGPDRIPTRGGAPPRCAPRPPSPDRTVRAGAAWSTPCARARCPRTMLASACGWPDDPARAQRITAALVDEGFAEWTSGPAAGAATALSERGVSEARVSSER